MTVTWVTMMPRLSYISISINAEQKNIMPAAMYLLGTNKEYTYSVSHTNGECKHFIKSLLLLPNLLK